MEDLKNNVVPLYFLGMNGLLFVLMGFDKLCAVMRKWRVPERTLLGIGLFGGGFYVDIPIEYRNMGYPLL